MSFITGLFSLAQWKAWLLGAVAVLMAIGIAVVKIRADGARAERLNQMQATLNRKKMEAQVEAANASLGARIRRERMQQRWSKD